MAKIRFYLKNQKNAKSTGIFMMVNYGLFFIKNGQKQYQPLKYYIGESILPCHWNKRTCRAKGIKDYPQYQLLNQRLLFIENLTHSLLLELKGQNKIVAGIDLRQRLNERLRSSVSNERLVQKKNLFQFISEFIQESRAVKAPSTILQYKNTLRILKNYVKKYQKIDFQDIDLRFYANFKKFMQDSGYSDTYFGNQIKFIRLFMNEATERGYNAQILYKSRKFSSPQQVSHKLYLSEEEIMRVQLLDLSDKKKLEESRDLFIIACKTGLRFSDLIRLTSINFSKKILCIQTKKTSSKVCIPLSSDILGLCEKYRFNLPSINNTTFNKHIKQICRIAGLSEEIAVEPFNKVGKLLVMPKYKLITAHTARRSFATNAFLAKIAPLSIMKITGHVTEQAFMKYIRISEEDNAKELLSHPYFF